MYHPRQGEDYEYLELFNSDSQNQVDISSWNFTTGIHFKFPPGSNIPPEGYIIVASKRDAFLRAYSDVLPEGVLVFGNMNGTLEDNGEMLTLVDSQHQEVFSMRWRDDTDFDFAADGYGSSLELMCYDAQNFSDGRNWRSSPLPTMTDPLKEFSGTPGRKSSWYDCPASEMAAKYSIYASEFMYHPVKEITRFEIHEFMEFFNNEDISVDMEGWRIASGGGRHTSVRFQFPANSVVPPKTYFVIAKDIDALRSIYPLQNVLTFGPYDGELANGGDRIGLFDSNGIGIELVEYDDKFPWPIGADALGASGSDLGINTTQFQYKGLSLNRVSFNVTTSKKYNWIAQLPTPGLINIGSRATPLPIVTEMNITQSINGIIEKTFFKPGYPTTIMVKFGPKNLVSTPTLEYYIEDLYQDNEAIISIPMTDDSGDIYHAVIPAMAANAIVRFRIKGHHIEVQGLVVLSPRSNDPMPWHGFFVAPADGVVDKSYHLFLRSDNWTQLWTNLATNTPHHIYLDPTLSTCCTLNPNWQNTVPAILGYRGKVYDVRTRYQGSYYSRDRGENIKNWTRDPPSAPSPLRQLSWKIILPNYGKIDGKSELYIMKPYNDACTLITTATIYTLAREIGIPAPKVEYTRLNINGGYYMYGNDMDF